MTEEFNFISLFLRAFVVIAIIRHNLCAEKCNPSYDIQNGLSRERTF